MLILTELEPEPPPYPSHAMSVYTYCPGGNVWTLEFAALQKSKQTTKKTRNIYPYFRSFILSIPVKTNIFYLVYNIFMAAGR